MVKEPSPEWRQGEVAGWSGNGVGVIRTVDGASISFKADPECGLRNGAVEFLSDVHGAVLAIRQAGVVYETRPHTPLAKTKEFALAILVFLIIGLLILLSNWLYVLLIGGAL